jgi:hypothetical protein
MKTFTYKKRIEVETTINVPTITFVAEKVRVSTGDSSWSAMGYVPRFNGLTAKEYGKEIGSYDAMWKMLEAYVAETFSKKTGYGAGYGSVDYHVYAGKDINMPELPKIDRDFNDDHADLVNMFKGL